MQVNPTVDGERKGGGGREVAAAGRKVLAAVGFVRRAAKRSGNPTASVRFVCVKDLVPGGGDVGAKMWNTFTITPKCAWVLARYALAVGVTEPFDPEDDTALTRVLTARPVVAEVRLVTYQGEWKAKVDDWFAYDGKIDKAWDDLVDEAEADFNAWVAKGAPSASREDGASRPATPSQDVQAGQAGDDDIPF